MSSALSCCETPAPLSPFMWDAPSCGVLVPVGCVPGPVADVCVQAKELSLRFDHLVSELEGPYYHPVRDTYQTHPIHTSSFSKHQFDVLRYGLVLDRSSGLVLVPVPRQCGDSGSVVANGYEALHGSSLNDTEASGHPLHEEHVFVVYQLSENSEQPKRPHAKALFRLVFRNEAYLNNASPDQSKHFPVFILRAVYISNDEFYRVHEVIAAHRAYHQHPVNPETNARSPDVCLLAELQQPHVVAIADAWIQVAEGILNTRYNFENISRVAAAASKEADLSSPRRIARDAKETPRSTLMDPQRFPLLRSQSIRTGYYNSYQRMESRLAIVQKNRDLIAQWRSGALDLSYFATEASGSVPDVKTAPCVRVLFRETRSGHNYIEEAELVAYLPQESDCERLQVYDSLPAERLRLWVLRALLTAEIGYVHNLLMEIDTPFMIAQCVGLLRGSETNRDREVLFHLCKIVVETVEDYLQHSGNIWKVTIAIADRPSPTDSTGNGDVDVVALCKDMAECIALSKHRLELETYTPAADAGSAAAISAAAQDSAGTVALFTPEQLAAQRGAISENVIFAAVTHRVFVTDEKLYPLFQYCDTNSDGFVSVQDLVKLFLCKENKIDRAHQQRGRYEAPLSDAEALRLQASKLVAHPLCALDGCGLPFDERTVYNFVRSFCKHVSASGEETLNYLEFSMMMLALAKR